MESKISNISWFIKAFDKIRSKHWRVWLDLCKSPCRSWRKDFNRPIWWLRERRSKAIT